MMNVLSAETITAVERPLADVSWHRDVADFVTDSFSEAVSLDDPTELRVNIVKPRELKLVTLPQSRSVSYVAAGMRRTLPPSFASALEVATSGAGYFKNDAMPKVPLLIKLGADLNLIAENDAVFDALAEYGMTPYNNYNARFNVIIGSVVLSKLAGREKQRLQYGITDRLPATISLSPGRILGRAARVAAEL